MDVGLGWDHLVSAHTQWVEPPAKHRTDQPGKEVWERNCQLMSFQDMDPNIAHNVFSRKLVLGAGASGELMETDQVPFLLQLPCALKSPSQGSLIQLKWTCSCLSVLYSVC